MKLILTAAAFLGMSLFSVNDKLTGTWETQPSPKGNIYRIVFKPDNSFDGFMNKKLFVTGTYTFQDSLFSFVDNGCDGIRGVYKVVFFSNEDSMRFVPVDDGCEERVNGMSRTIVGRVK